MFGLINIIFKPLYYNYRSLIKYGRQARRYLIDGYDAAETVMGTKLDCFMSTYIGLVKMASVVHPGPPLLMMTVLHRLACHCADRPQGPPTPHVTKAHRLPNRVRTSTDGRTTTPKTTTFKVSLSFPKTDI